MKDEAFHPSLLNVHSSTLFILHPSSFILNSSLFFLPSQRFRIAVVDRHAHRHPLSQS